ncbi:hypothetical protein HY968_02880 [Candidatus Kaiserbacteria bacterium]|nr:hypothetical protein [Candidatus Kaiserbacteria bacterium]
MKTILIIGGVAIVLLVGGVWWSNSLSAGDANILARSGLHWHPALTIYVKGEKVEIPQNVGIGTTHMPMHTHDDLPLIHLEFSGVVHKKDLRLGQFFTNWGKDIRGFGAHMQMTVNGKDNTEYENYVMHDGDKIELHYE